MRSTETHERTDYGNRVAWLSLLLSGGLLAVKFLAYELTGSAAVLSDALESIVNVIASSFALFSVTLSARPPDASHPYGHGRVEFFSAGFEGALIVVAAVAIFAAALPRLFDPQPLAQLSLGIGLVGAAGVIQCLARVVLAICWLRRPLVNANLADRKPCFRCLYQCRGTRGYLRCVAHRLVYTGRPDGPGRRSAHPGDGWTPGA